MFSFSLLSGDEINYKIQVMNLVGFERMTYKRTYFSSKTLLSSTLSNSMNILKLVTLVVFWTEAVLAKVGSWMGVPVCCTRTGLKIYCVLPEYANESWYTSKTECTAADHYGFPDNPCIFIKVNKVRISSTLPKVFTYLDKIELLWLCSQFPLLGQRPRPCL